MKHQRNQNVFALLFSIMETLHGEGQIDELICEALQKLDLEIGVEHAVLWLLCEEDRYLYGVSEIGSMGAAGLRISSGHGIVGETVSEGQIKRVGASDSPYLIAGKDEITGIEVKNMLCVPVMLPGKVIGCVQMLNKTDEMFTEDDEYLVRSFSGIAAMVLDEKGYRVAPDADRTCILSMRNIRKVFPSGDGTVEVLKGIDLDIYENELLVILGESGCGKSTLLNIIGGMDTMTEGSMVVDGRDFSHAGRKRRTAYRRDYVGFIFQSYNLMPNLTALDNVRLIAELCRDPMDSMEALQLMGIGEKAYFRPKTMSGGQQQRIAIARAIVKKPKLILADEPTAALDFRTGKDVLIALEKLIKSHISTVVIVTHNTEIAKMANRVLRIRDGKILSIHYNAWPMEAKDLEW